MSLKQYPSVLELPSPRHSKHRLTLTVAATALAVLAACGGASEERRTPANKAPTIDIVAPQGLAYTEGASVALTAAAQDADGAIAMVEFFDGDTRLGQDTTAPFEFTWSDASVGNHQVTARATDDSGAVAISASLQITVTASPVPPPPNQPPTVSLTAPANGFKPNAPATLTLAASATDTDGSIASVSFYRIDAANPLFDATTLVGSALTAAPYQQTTPALPAGTYTFVARAIDNDGRAATSASVQVIVNALPTVDFNEPAANTVLQGGASATLRATATDADGSIARLEFFEGGRLLGAGTRVVGSDEYTYTWSNVTAGAKTLVARATDNDGATQTTASVTINANGQPTVSLDAPVAGANAPTTLQLAASATDADGNIASVQFYNGTTLLGAGTFDAGAQRYRLGVPVTAAGTYSITARATDNSGGAATTASRGVTIAPNVAPTVGLTSPTAFNLLTGVVTFTADATDSDGIARVEFYDGSTKLGEDTTAPFSYTWTTATAGNYSVTARAVDAVGTSTTSAVQSVRITDSPVAGTITHPGAPLSLTDLRALKTYVEQGRQPWKSGYDQLALDGRAKLSYTMAGPFAKVSRSPNVNLGAWRNDMVAVWNLSRMWYFTGDEAYAQKARQILLAWASMQVEFSGLESMLDLGDYAYRFVGGADILRATWPGWKDEDTATVKKYFKDVLLPASNPYGESMFGAANKGALALNAMGLMAIYNDDIATLDKVVYQVRTLAHIGLRNSNDIGMLGDSLRDQGHAHGQLLSLVMLAEALWKQGIDIYSDFDNRLLAAAEYFARVNERAPTVALPFGTTDAYYTADNTDRGWPGGVSVLHHIHAAYVLRKGMQAPYVMQRRTWMPVDADSFMFIKEADSSKALPAASLPIPTTASVTTGLRSIDIGGAIPAGSATYAAGKWTVQGGGAEIWGTRDSCHFVYKALTGNSAIIAKVDSVQNTNASAKAGVMMRTSLSAGAPRAWMAITNKIQAEQNMPNVAVYGGSNYGNKAFNIAASSPSYWLKLERIGNVITGYVSPDGTNWAATDVGRIEAPAADTIYVGLVVASLANGTLNTSTFSHVQITGGDGGGPSVTPEAPAALLASPGDGAVPLRWQLSSGATSYTILRSTGIGGPYVTLATGVTGSSYTDKSVSNGTTYHYTVTASNAAGTSGNSPEDIATPVRQVVNIATGGTSNDSANNPSNAAMAFDSNSATQWLHPRASGWLQYDLGLAKIVQQYTVTSSNGVIARDPKDWQFEGSRDGSSWTTLDSRSNQSFPERYKINAYVVAVPAAYRYYRLNITANNGDGTATGLSELRLLVDRPQ